MCVPCYSESLDKILAKLENRMVAEDRVDAAKRTVALLPYAAIEGPTVGAYLREARLFTQSCVDFDYDLVPASWQAITHYLLTKFEAGRTTRSNAGVVTKIKWYYTNILQEGWLSEADVRLLRQARTALAKHEFSIVRKSKPLYGWILKAIWSKGLVVSARHRAIFALWVLAYSIMARFGEVVGRAAVRFRQLRLIGGDRGRTYVFHHDVAPKANKLREAEYATISERASPFCFAIVHAHVVSMRTVLFGPPLPGGLVFPAITEGGKISLGRSFNKGNALALLQKWLGQLRVPEPGRYTGHGSRRGRYNDVKDTVPDELINSQAHWAPGSTTAKRDYSYASFAERRLCF